MAPKVGYLIKQTTVRARTHKCTSHLLVNSILIKIRYMISKFISERTW
jgi:hypothetical protein